MINSEQWMNREILEKKYDFFLKKPNKNISKKFISWEILPLTWHVISMLENPLTEYSYDWYFNSCAIFKISFFFNVLKRLSFINKPTYQNSVRGFHSIPVADRVGVVIYKC